MVCRAQIITGITGGKHLKELPMLPKPPDLVVNGGVAVSYTHLRAHET